MAVPVDNSARSQVRPRRVRHRWMDGKWTVGVLAAGVENVQAVAAGEEATVGAAIGAASDALVVAAMDRGREEYRVSVAGAQMMVIPGLTDEGEVDVCALRGALVSIAAQVESAWYGPT